MLMLPWIPFTVTIGKTALTWAWFRLVGTHNVLGVHLFFMAECSADVRACALRGLSHSVPFLHIVYNGLCLRAFNTFSCFTLRDGASLMHVAPDIVCHSSTHRAMVVASAFAIIFYVIGIPAYVYGTMLYARHHDRLKDAEWLEVLGFLYTRFGQPR